MKTRGGKDDRNPKRRNAHAGLSKEQKKEVSRLRKARRQKRKAEAADALKAPWKALGFTKRPRFYFSQ